MVQDNFQQLTSYKNDEKCFFIYHLRSLFCFWDISIFLRIFGHVEKRLDKKANFQNLRRHTLDNKQLQYTYFRISQEVKAIR